MNAHFDTQKINKDTRIFILFRILGLNNHLNSIQYHRWLGAGNTINKLSGVFAQFWNW